MPNRIIRESLLEDARLARLSLGAQLLFFHLYLRADDFGRLNADVTYVTNTAFPSNRMKPAEVEGWLGELGTAGALRLYAIDGQPYGEIAEDLWKQRHRSEESKYPEFQAGSQTTVTRPSDDGHPSDKRPPQTETYSKTETKTCTETETSMVTATAGFESFWDSYPRKTAKAKALEAWSKLHPTPELTATIVSAVALQAQWPDWTKDQGQFIPHPATWLNGRRWEDLPRAPTLSSTIFSPKTAGNALVLERTIARIRAEEAAANGGPT